MVDGWAKKEIASMNTKAYQDKIQKELQKTTSWVGKRLKQEVKIVIEQNKALIQKQQKQLNENFEKYVRGTGDEEIQRVLEDKIKKYNK